MKLTFKSIFRTLALVAVFLLAGGTSKVMATHYAAGDMYAKFIGRDSLDLKYEVHLIVYFNCKDAYFVGPGGIALAGNQEIINWTSANATGGTRTVIARISDTTDQLCGNLKKNNACYTPGSIYPGYARREYIDTFILNSAQPDWKFSWSNGNRFAQILNLDAPDNYNLYIELGLNNTGRFWGNSTGVFRDSPVPYYCAGLDNTILNTPEDPENLDPFPENDDSLVTMTAIPRSTATLNIPYSNTSTMAPYSVTNPFGGAAGSFVLNSTTGDANFIPPLTGKFVVAFTLSSYNKETGVRTSYITRDVQTAVIPCAARRPFIDTIPSNFSGVILQPGNIISICPNQTTTFDIKASSNSTTNYVFLEPLNLQGSAPGSNFTFDTSAGVTIGHFSWTPTTNDIGTHLIKFLATDTTCDPSQPIKLFKRLTVTLIVRPGLDAGPDLKICPLGDYPVQLLANGPSNKIYKWISGDGSPARYLSDPNVQNPFASPPTDYTYILTSADPDFVCKARDTVNVLIDRSNGLKVQNDPLVVCRPSYVTIGVDSIGVGPVKNIPCGIMNTITCTTPEVISIGNSGTTGTYKLNTPFYSSSRYHKYQFIIPKSQLRNAGLYSGTLSSISFLSNNAILGAAPLSSFRISLACTDQVNFSARPTNATFVTATTLVATVPAFTIVPQAWNKITFDQGYNWDTTKNLLVDICMGALNPPNVGGVDPVDMMTGQTIQRFSDNIDVCSGNAADTSIFTYNQRPIVRFDYCHAEELPFQYRWKPGTNLADSNTKYTTAYVAESINYAVYSVGRNGCLLRDSLHIIVPHYTLKIDPKDTAVCVGQPAPLHATGAQAYKWYENGFNKANTLSCDDCADPVATPTAPGDIIYTVVFMNPDNCYDTLTQTLHVYGLPTVKIVNNDTTIKYGQRVQLYVNGANQYTWTPVGSLDDPNVPNPIASPTQSTTYIVYGLNRNQCSGTDTVRINVDFRDNLLIPTGFTPNNDGRNDYFRVVNVTFQKLMEFRVYNRWGQEVFSTNDPQKGWDGKWKGVDQDMGVYKYLIRVAFPDGYVESYKGDVTLIR